MRQGCSRFWRVESVALEQRQQVLAAGDDGGDRGEEGEDGGIVGGDGQKGDDGQFDAEEAAGCGDEGFGVWRCCSGVYNVKKAGQGDERDWRTVG